MPARFLTLDEIQSQRDRAIQIGAEHVERFYMHLGKGFDEGLRYIISVIKSIQILRDRCGTKASKIGLYSSITPMNC